MAQKKDFRDVDVFRHKYTGGLLDGTGDEHLPRYGISISIDFRVQAVCSIPQAPTSYNWETRQ
jgi:hypothetical protein